MSDLQKKEMVLSFLQKFKSPEGHTPFLDLLLEEQEANRTGNHRMKTIWRQMSLDLNQPASNL